MEKLILKIFQKIKRESFNYETYKDALDAITLYKETDKEKAYKLNKNLRDLCIIGKKKLMSEDDVDYEAVENIESIRKESYRIESTDIFDSYLIYLEWNRPAEKKFYLPRRKVLKALVDDLQDLADRKIKFLGISLPPRVGKSTLCIMFMTLIMGKYPDYASVMSGHSDKLTDGFYKEVLSIIEDTETYLWHEVFTNTFLADNSAKNETIDLNKKKRFPTLTCRSIGGTLTGAVEIGEFGLLYCDDLIEDLEESLSIDRLENKYNAYLNQLKDRKKDGAIELMVGTRWNVFDPFGRIAEQYSGNPDYRFTVIPALNDNDESNFNYKYGVGFTTEYYHDMRNSIDDATWWAKYMGQPYVREGLLFPKDELNYYNGTLPGGTPDRIISCIDVAWGGGDYLSMPVAYLFGDSCYIHDVVFSNQDKRVTFPLVCGMIKRHGIHQVEVEANNGGTEFCSEIERILKNDNIHVNLSYRSAPNKTSKLSRIVQYSPEIRKMYFIDSSHSLPEYKEFMRNLTSFVITGKNKNDDAPDSLTMVANLIARMFGEPIIFKRPF
jgi:predicted phage terminase large subunit-like protein